MKVFFSRTVVCILISLTFSIGCEKAKKKEIVSKKPNILFVMMDDLGYGQWGVNNTTLNTDSFDPYFVQLVKERQDYTPEEALQLSKMAIPTMTSLAKDGVVFSNAYTSSNLCAPSRMGIATGVFQGKYGIYTNLDCEAKGLEKGTHLAEKLKDLGYATAHIGKWHIGRRDGNVLKNVLREAGIDENMPYRKVKEINLEAYKAMEASGYRGSVIKKDNPLNHGFDYYYGYNYWASQFYNSTLVWENYEHAGKQKGYNTDVFTDKALDFIKEQAKSDKPFYVQLDYHAVHDSLQPKAPSKYYDKFKTKSYDLNNFYAHVYGVDYNLKRITEYLKSINQLENTIIAFTSDNGGMTGGPSTLPGNAPFAGHKGTYYQGGMHVPMFFYWKGKIHKGFKSDELVSAMDIIPTLIDAAEGKVPENIDGKSLLPLVTKQTKEPVHDYLYWAGIHSRKWGFLLNKSVLSRGEEPGHAPPAWTVIKENYLLRYVGEIEKGIYTDFLEGDKPKFELYNILKDPSEKYNLAQELPDKVKELVALYNNNKKELKPPVDWKKAKWEELVSIQSASK